MDYTTPEDILDIYFSFREDARDRDTRFDLMHDVLNKKWGLKDAGGEAMKPRSSNKIATALEDTAEATATMPTIRVRPQTITAGAKEEASLMEQIAAGYFDQSIMELEIPRYVMDLGAYGLCPLVVLPDFEARSPKIIKKDPREAYLERRFHPGDTAHRALFVREVRWTQLLPEHRAILSEFRTTNAYQRERDKVILVEWYTDHEISLFAFMHRGMIRSGNAPKTMYQPVPLEQEPNPIKVCPVVPLSRITRDNEFRGQFDDIVDPMLSYARLMAMAIDFADQAVYSDIWARDVIGDVPFGGGSFIELGPNGAIGRVPPAVSSLDLYRDLERLEEEIHTSGRWPKSRPGQIDQAIASGKFVEATVGMMSTVIKTYHQVLARGLAKALYLCFLTDRAYFGGTKKMSSAIMRGQHYLIEYSPREHINLDHRVTVEYGLGLGRDATSSAVLMMNYAKDEFISHEFVQENIEGLTDVERERRRIDTEKIEKMMWASMLQAVEQQELPKEKLADLHEAREKGEPIVKVFKDLFAPDEEDPNSEIAALAALLGIGGPGPGAPQAPVPAPGPPPGPLPPQAPDGREMLARIGVPAGPGSVIGSQVQG